MKKKSFKESFKTFRAGSFSNLGVPCLQKLFKTIFAKI